MYIEYSHIHTYTCAFTLSFFKLIKRQRIAYIHVHIHRYIYTTNIHMRSQFIPLQVNQDAEEAFNKWSNSSDLVRKDLHWPPFLAGYKAGKKS
jgi:hypothetical protein